MEELHTAQGTHAEAQNADKQSAVVGNERLTALAGAVLFVLIVVELVTTAYLRALLSAHVFVGVLLVGPLVVKLGSTFYRFLRYYTGSPAFVRKGPPHLLHRVLGPLLIATTLLVVGSGIGLTITGPAQAGPLIPLHSISVLVWFPVIAIHIFAYIWRVPHLVADDWRNPSDRNMQKARRSRLITSLGALLLGTLAATLLLPGATPWIAWSQTDGIIPAPVVLGTLVATLLLIVTRPWRLKVKGR